MKKHGYKGMLVVVEGTDFAGKSTQIELLKKYLECQAFGVVVSEWKSSDLIASVIDDAKDRNLFNANTFSLMYAADFAYRMENHVIPSLEAGFVVLMDRYTYTAYARDVVRGVKPAWVRKLYDYAPVPDLTFYLDLPVKSLMKRIIAAQGFDYYESGRDIGFSTDFYESFKIYQTKILEEYSKMVDEYGFVKVDGNKSIEDIHEFIKDKTQKLLKTKFE
ncbi:MAG: dTMP kinase [bacterium]|nr:dTMP kinase [bacterium]